MEDDTPEILYNGGNVRPPVVSSRRRSSRRPSLDTDEFMNLLHGSDPVKLELNRLENEVRDKDQELSEAQVEIKALRLSERLCEKAVEESIKKLETQLAVKKSKDEILHKTSSGELIEVKKKLHNEIVLRKAAEEEVKNLQNQVLQWKRSEAALNAEMSKLQKMLEDEVHQREKREEEISMLQNQLLQISFDADETRKQLEIGDHSVDMTRDMGSLISPVRQEKGNVAKLFEQVGLQKILSLLEADDPDVRIHAVKVIANLAAEGILEFMFKEVLNVGFRK